MFSEKALKLAHMLFHTQREVGMIADVAQAAADGMRELDTRKADKSDLDAAVLRLEQLIDQKIAAHDASEESHPTHISVRLEE